MFFNIGPMINNTVVNLYDGDAITAHKIRCVPFLPQPLCGGLILSHSPCACHAIFVAGGVLRLRQRARADGYSILYLPAEAPKADRIAPAEAPAEDTTLPEEPAFAPLALIAAAIGAAVVLVVGGSGD